MITWLIKTLTRLGLRDPRCCICDIAIGERYWRARAGKPFANILRFSCEIRRVCVDCGVAQEKARAEISR